MARYKRFTFLCDNEERRILAALAQHLERSRSDTVRWLIRNAAQELDATLKDDTPATGQPAELESAHA